MRPTSRKPSNPFLGSVIALTDPAQNVTDRWTYDAFGGIIAEQGATPNLYNFVGALGVEGHVGHGLLYMRHRYYDPVVGRFISEDPLRDGLNWYAYCGNDPVNGVDPWGLEPMTPQQVYQTMLQHGTIYPPEMQPQQHPTPWPGVPYPGHGGYPGWPGGPGGPYPGSGPVDPGDPTYVPGLDGPPTNGQPQQPLFGPLDPLDPAIRQDLERQCWEYAKGYIGYVIIPVCCQAASIIGEVGEGAVVPKPKPTTPPTLPKGNIVNGPISVKHYFPKDHPPAHAHVIGGGPPTKIGPAGHPLKGCPELTPQQRKVVEEEASLIRKIINKIGRWLDWNEEYGGNPPKTRGKSGPPSL